jgi:hypothetical protein
MKDYYLRPIYNHQKSFYKKARVIQNNNGIHLTSYNTVVAVIDTSLDRDKALTVFGTYSSTTLKHIKDFMYQYGYSVPCKKDILKLYCK